LKTLLTRFEGIAWILLASASFAAMGAFTKAAVAGVGVADAVFWRSVVVMLVALGLSWRQGVSLRPGNLRLMLWRSGIGLVAMGLFFWSIGQIELGLAHTLLYTSPLFMPLLSGRMLGEGGGVGDAEYGCGHEEEQNQQGGEMRCICEYRIAEMIHLQNPLCNVT